MLNAPSLPNIPMPAARQDLMPSIAYIIRNCVRYISRYVGGFLFLPPARRCSWFLRLSLSLGLPLSRYVACDWKIYPWHGRKTTALLTWLDEKAWSLDPNTRLSGDLDPAAP